MISLVASWTGWGTGSDWKGLAIGDIDSTEYFPVDMTEGNILSAGNLDDESDNDELIVLRNSDGGMVAYAHTEPVLASSAKSAVAMNNSNINDENMLDDPLVDISKTRVYPNPTTGILNIEYNEFLIILQIIRYLIPLDK